MALTAHMCPLGSLVYNRGMYTSKIRPAIEKYLEDRPNEAAFLRSEFNGLGKTRSGVDKALRAMVKDGKLVRVGYGAYVKAETIISPITGDPIVVPIAFREQWGAQILRKLGVDPKQNSALRAYNENRSTQVPAWFAFDVGNSRIRRQIGFGKGRLVYERSK
ncbi:hypothetical protein [Ferrimicrobium acidiphilum]|uniref:S-adenosylhomocysteine hydrolase n=3 Tax=Ferrimicrobium TaxID=121038 RepID=A0A0D8FV85_9ACTN|nr:hypothetical protein [Ferrimicrobium acidiphilum]KJE76167.1 hypothetical protein FEAC_20290 [Ferrimicrobium acidiphilum DSM 19497]